MITRRRLITLLSVGVLFPASFGMKQLARAQNGQDFEDTLAEIARGRPVLPGRVKIGSDSIVKEDKPLQVTVEIRPLESPKDEAVVLHLLLSNGPWPLAYSATLKTNNGRAHLTTRLRIFESCTLQAIAEFDGEELYGATKTVKVSSGAYVP